MSLQKRITHKIEELKTLEQDLPALLIVHDIRDSSVIFMSKRALDGLGVTLQELAQMGQDYHARFFNPEDAADYVPKILGLLERNNDEEIVSFFQQVRKNPASDWTWYLSSIKILLRDEANAPVLTLTTSIPVDAQHHIANKAQRILNETTFQRKNAQNFSQLSGEEREVLRLVGLGYSDDEIAQMLHIPQTNAACCKQNVSEKLKTNTQYDFIRFAQAFDLL